MFSVITTAVEQMLDKFDRQLADRYKLITYRDADNAKLVSVLPNHFMGVSVPTILGKENGTDA